MTAVTYRASQVLVLLPGLVLYLVWRCCCAHRRFVGGHRYTKASGGRRAVRTSRMAAATARAARHAAVAVKRVATGTRGIAGSRASRSAGRVRSDLAH